MSTIAQQLRIAMQTLSNWQNKTNQGKLVVTEPYYTEVMAVLEGIKPFKRRLKIAEARNEKY